jgi:hypothetical protein
MNRILTFSSRSFRLPSDFTSAARLRGPYWRVSCKPKELAVSLIDADLDTDAGTMRRDDSYVFVKLCNKIIERSVYHVVVEDKDAYALFFPSSHVACIPWL